MEPLLLPWGLAPRERSRYRMPVQPLSDPPPPNSERRPAAESFDPMERSKHLATAFLRRIAHDIASPTGVTMTVLDELAVGAKPELVTMARRGLRRLLRLSEQLALAADLESGAFSPDTAPEDLRVVVQSAFDHAVGIDGRRDVTPELSLPKERITVDVDRRIVASTIREIIGNALRLATSRVAVEVVEEGGRVAIFVHDDGPGFKDEVKASLGERFTARSSTRGLGLSISMAKDILAAHGGDLAFATSKLPPGRRGTGACVVVRLPIAPPSQTSQIAR